MKQLFLLVVFVGINIMASETKTEAEGLDLTELRRPQDNDTLPAKGPDHILNYGPHKSQFVHIRLPDHKRYGPGPFPTIIVLHGGCWVRPYASLNNSAAFADALRDAGYATINGEYRTIDEAGGGWPGTLEDVAAISDGVDKWSETLPLDPTRIVTTGHSAGGHLALWSLARTALPTNSPLYQPNATQMLGSVILGGPGDLLAAQKDWAKGCGIDSITPFLGGSELKALNAASASPAELLPFDGKQIFITGSRDHVVPPHLGDAYVAKARQAGSDATHMKIEATGHHEYLAPTVESNWTVIKEAFDNIFTNPDGE